MADRNQPSTIDIQQLTKRDATQASFDESRAENNAKFTTGKDVEALMASIGQLLDTFTKRTLNNIPINTELVLRSVYRNMDDDLLEVLGKQENVEKLNSQLSDLKEDDVKDITGLKDLIDEFVDELNSRSNKLKLKNKNQSSQDVFDTGLDSYKELFEKQQRQNATHQKQLQDMLDEVGKEEKPDIDLDPKDELPKDIPFGRVKVIVASPKLTEKLLDRLRISQKALRNAIGDGKKEGSPAGGNSLIFKTAGAMVDKVNTGVGNAIPPTNAPKGKGETVSILKSQLMKLQELANQQQQQATDADKLSKKEDEEKPKLGLGVLSQRRQMSDDEAYRRNISEGYTALQKALGDKKLSAIALPQKQLSKAISSFFGYTSQIAENTDADLNSIDRQLSSPRIGLVTRIKAFIIKTVLIGVGSFIAVTWFRKTYQSWLPRDENGQVLHGAKIFGVQLPNFKDLINISKSMFAMLTTPLKKFLRMANASVKKFLKSNEIKDAPGFLRWVKNFAIGYVTGKALNYITGGGDSPISRFMGQLLDQLISKIPAVAGIKLTSKLIAMIAGALVAAIQDMMGGGKSDDGLGDEALEWGQERHDELTGEDKFGAKAMKKLVKKSRDIKPLIPIQNILPDSLKIANQTGETRLKGLVPNLPAVKFQDGGWFTTSALGAEGAARRENEDKAQEKLQEEANKTSTGRIASALSRRPDPDWTPRDTYDYGAKTPAKVQSLKFLHYADQQRRLLKKERDRYGRMDDFDGPWREWFALTDRAGHTWTFNGGMDPNIAWDPKWQYIGENAWMLKSIMPNEPFGEAIEGQAKHKLGDPWKKPDMGGVLPLGVIMPGTGAAYHIDAIEQEYDRLDIGYQAWDNIYDYVHDKLEDRWFGDSIPVYGTKEFEEKVNKYSQDWVSRVTEPRSDARINDLRIQGMVADYNQWLDRWARTKETVKQLKSDLDKERAKDRPSTAPTLAQPRPPAPVVPDYTHGNDFMKREMANNATWGKLTNPATKPEDLKKFLKIDTWFNEKPPVGDSAYQSEIGRMFYNILMSMGFKYDKRVWQNPQFLKERPNAMKTLTESVNAYLHDLVEPYGKYILALKTWGLTHKTKQEQDMLIDAAKKEMGEFEKNITKEKFLEYMSKYYIPTDVHLVLRDAKGNIVREEGKELRGLTIPKELYNQDPKYWDSVTEVLNRTSIPPESMIELGEMRQSLLQSVNLSAWKISMAESRIKLQEIDVKARNRVADMLIRKRAEMYQDTVFEFLDAIEGAKNEIRLYYKYQKWLNTGSPGAFRTMSILGDWLNRWYERSLFGKQVGDQQTLGQQLLGSVSEIIADRKGLIQRMREILSKVIEGDAKTEQKSDEAKLLMVQTTFKKMLSDYREFAFKKSEHNAKLTARLDSLMAANLDLFGAFVSKRGDLDDLGAQLDVIVEELLPDEDADGQERLKKIVMLAEERKKEALNKKKSWRGYWEDLRRKWRDRISEESMKELKGASLKLSDNILEYIGLVREVPAGNTTLVSQTIQEQPSVINLLPDIVFC